MATIENNYLIRKNFVEPLKYSSNKSELSYLIGNMAVTTTTT